MARSYLLILGTVALGATGQLCIKAGASRLEPVSPSLQGFIGLVIQVLRSPLLLLGLTFWSLGALLWIVTLSRVQLTYAYPMLSLGYVIVFAGSWILFKESVSLMRVVGAVIVVIGVILISRS